MNGLRNGKSLLIGGSKRKKEFFKLDFPECKVFIMIFDDLELPACSGVTKPSITSQNSGSFFKKTFLKKVKKSTCVFFKSLSRIAGVGLPKVSESMSFN